ncbi:hypothetical protein OF83DRAFT_1169504 [Amylostereum chailletii]|nr:hypothetical protein OF83DRAFT_1169504 [Amylostereum chailletii]
MSDPETALVSTQLAAFWVVGPLYGINLTLAILATVLLFRRGFVRGPNRYLVITIGLQLAICTAHTVTLVVQMIRAFIGHPDFEERVQYLQHQEYPIVLAQQALWVLNTIIGDCFMIWRVYAVWNKNIILCLPFFVLEVVLIISSSYAVHAQGLVKPGDLFILPLRRWLTISCVTSLLIQCGGICLIGWRALSTPTRVTSSPRRRFSILKILATIVDSGVIYAIAFLMVLIAFSSEWLSIAIFAAMLGQISATVPLSIVLRECWKASRDDELHTRTRPGILTPNVYDLQERNVSQLSRSSSDGPANLNVVVMRATHHHADPLMSGSKSEKPPPSPPSTPRRLSMYNMPAQK